VTKLAVLISVWILLFVFLPQQNQRDGFTTQLTVDVMTVRDAPECCPRSIGIMSGIDRNAVRDESESVSGIVRNTHKNPAQSWRIDFFSRAEPEFYLSNNRESQSVIQGFGNRHLANNSPFCGDAPAIPRSWTIAESTP
jgi:hypothetical protein